MPRPPRADEAGGLYHALNRGNMRAEIFHKEATFFRVAPFFRAADGTSSVRVG